MGRFKSLNCGSYLTLWTDCLRPCNWAVPSPIPDDCRRIAFRRRWFRPGSRRRRCWTVRRFRKSRRIGRIACSRWDGRRILRPCSQCWARPGELCVRPWRLSFAYLLFAREIVIQIIACRPRKVPRDAQSIERSADSYPHGQRILELSLR